MMTNNFISARQAVNLEQAKWLRDKYRMNLIMLINQQRAGFISEFWDKDFAWTWEQYKIAQRLYVNLKRGVVMTDPLTFEEGEE